MDYNSIRMLYEVYITGLEVFEIKLFGKKVRMVLGLFVCCRSVFMDDLSFDAPIGDKPNAGNQHI